RRRSSDLMWMRVIGECILAPAKHDQGIVRIRTFRKWLAQIRTHRFNSGIRFIQGGPEKTKFGSVKVLDNKDTHHSLVHKVAKSALSDSMARAGQKGRWPVPLQNRVDPFGEIHATPERGLFTGNRGVIHSPTSKTLLK